MSEEDTGSAASVTAIIPTYNRAKYLREALSSVLGQTLPPAQVIVVDDGSKDNTPAVVAEFGSRVEYIAKPNGGKASALNLGLGHTKGDLVWIFDDDDIAEPDALRRLANALRDHPECGFSYGDSGSFTADEAGLIRKNISTLPTVKPENLFVSVLLGGFTSAERRFVFQQQSLVRKSCYDEVGPFDETLIRSQDFEMLVRLAYCYVAVKVEGIIFHQRLHAGMRGSQASQVSADRVLDAWLKNDQKLLARFYGTYDLRDFVPHKSLGSQLTEGQTFTGLLQRSCIMARKGLWDKAALDLRLAGDIAQTTRCRTLTGDQEEILRLFFDLSSFGPHTFANATEFRRALKEMKPVPLQRRMRAAILWSLPFTIGAVLLHRQYADFWRFLRVYFTLVTPDAIMRTVFNRAFFGAGWELVRARRSITAGERFHN